MPTSEITPPALAAMQPDFPAQIDDETLRDGLQDPNIRQPSPEEAVVLFDLMHQLGTHRADIGFAGAGPIHQHRIHAIAQYNASLDTPLEISCAARTKTEDIAPIIDISQQTGTLIWADTFIDSDPNRMELEDWTQDFMIKQVENSVAFAVNHGINVMMVTENTVLGIQKTPTVVERLYLTALHQGAQRVCIADTTGAADYAEVDMAVKWMRQLLDNNGFSDVGIDFHGHQDLHMAVANSVAALKAGAQRVHATILGVGERCGNTDRIPLQLALRKTGLDQGAYNLRIIPAYAEAASRILGIPIPSTEPGLGEESRAVVAGIHAAAVLKAYRKLPRAQAAGVYLPINYHQILGLEPPHIAKIGPMAGKTNVQLWGVLHGLDITDHQVDTILAAAKEASQPLTNTEIRRLLE